MRACSDINRCSGNTNKKAEVDINVQTQGKDETYDVNLNAGSATEVTQKQSNEISTEGMEGCTNIETRATENYSTDKATNNKECKSSSNKEESEVDIIEIESSDDEFVLSEVSKTYASLTRKKNGETEQRNIRRSPRVKSIRNTKDDQNTTVSSGSYSKESMTMCSKLSERNSTNTQNEAVKEQNQVDAQSVVEDHNYSDVNQTETEEPSGRKSSRKENKKESQEENLETEEPSIRKSSRIENKKDSLEEKMETEEPSIRKSSRIENKKESENDSITSVSSDTFLKEPESVCSKSNERSSASTPKKAVKERNKIPVDAKNAVKDHNYSDVKQVASNEIRKEIIKDHNYSDVKQIASNMIQKEKTETEELSIRKSSRIENKKDSQAERMETEEPSIRKSSRIENKKDSHEEKIQTEEPSVRKSSRIENKKDSQAEKMETEKPSIRKSSRIENKKGGPAEKMETEITSIRKSSRIENKKESQEQTMETEEPSVGRSAGIYINKKKDSENDNVTSVSLDTFTKGQESMCSKTNSAHNKTVRDQLINVPSEPLSEECLQSGSNITAAQNGTVESEIIQTKNAGKKSLEKSKSLGSDTNEAHSNMTADKLSDTCSSSGELLGENGPVCSDVDADGALTEDLTLNNELNESDESDNDIEMEEEECVENTENLDSDSSSPSQSLVSDNQCVIPQKSNLQTPISYNYNKYKSKFSSGKKSKSLPCVEPLIIDCNESNEIHFNPVSKKYQGKKLTSTRSEVQNTTSEYVPFIVDCAVPEDVIASDNSLDEATESDKSDDEATDCTSEINKSIENLNAMEVSYDETGSEDETPLINLSDTSDAIPELTNESPGAERFPDISVSDTLEQDDGNSAETTKTSENTENANVNDIITIDDDDDSKDTEMDSVSDLPQQDENNASKPSVSDAMETEKQTDKSEKKQSQSSASKTVRPSYIVVNTVTSSSVDNKGRHLDVYDRRNEMMELEDLGNIKRKPRNNCRKFQLDKETMIANNSVVGEYVPGHPYMGQKPTPGPSTKRQMKYLESGIMTKTTENKRVRDKNITQIYTRPGHELLSPKLKKFFRSNLPPLPSSTVKSPEPTSSRQSSVDSVTSVNSDNPTDKGCTSGNQCETGSVNTETDKVNIIKTEHSEEEYEVSQVNKTYSGVESKGNAITEQQNQTIPSRSEKGNTETEQQNMQRSSEMKSNTDIEDDQIDCKDNIPILTDHPYTSHNDQVSNQPGTSNQLGDNCPVSGTVIKTEQVEAEQAVIPKNVSVRKSPSQAVIPENVSARKSPSQAVIPENVSARKSPSQTVIPENVSPRKSPSQAVIPKNVSARKSQSQAVITENVSARKSPRQLTAKNKEKFKNIIDAVRSSRITREVN